MSKSKSKPKQTTKTGKPAASPSRPAADPAGTPRSADFTIPRNRKVRSAESSNPVADPTGTLSVAEGGGVDATLVFIVNGEEVRIELESEAPLAAARDEALAKTRNTGRPPGDWDLQNSNGTLIADVSKPISLYGFAQDARLFLTLHVGAGGEPHVRNKVVAYDDSERLQKRLNAVGAKKTVSQYQQDWVHFQRWCEERNVPHYPANPENVASYLVDLAEAKIPWEIGLKRKVSSINRKKCAIKKHHQLIEALLPRDQRTTSPTDHETVKYIWLGIRYELGEATTRKTAITKQQLSDYMGKLPSGIIGTRDRALLLVGFFGAFRRSSLVAMDVDHVRYTNNGMTVLVPKEKNDQFKKGRTIAISSRHDEICPVKALREWLSVSGIVDGPVFRPTMAGNIVNARLSEKSVALRVKRAMRELGLKEEDFAGHSLRAGFVTAAYTKDAKPFQIMDVTGHKSFEMLRRYIRDVDIWRDPAGARI